MSRPHSQNWLHAAKINRPRPGSRGRHSLRPLTLELGHHHQTSVLLMFALEPAGDDGEVGDLWALSLLDARPKHPDGTPTLERRPGGAS